MSHNFRQHHVFVSTKTGMNGGKISKLYQIHGGGVREVKERRDPRTGKIHHIPVHGSGIAQSILEPAVKAVRKYRNRFNLSDVPGALSRALGGDGLVRVM